MKHAPSSTEARASRPRGALSSAASALGWVGLAAGVLAGIAMLVLATSVLLGIVLRTVGIDNSWTYDLDHFSLIWLAFTGAAYTGYRGAHVTSGISLENLLGRRAIILVVIRFIIAAGFLAVFTWSGYQQFHSSWLFGEATLDIAQWPVWVAKFALPVGTAAWFVAECHKLLAHLAGTPVSTDPAD